MGGMGSGRTRFGSRASLTCERQRIDIRYWAKLDVLKPGCDAIVRPDGTNLHLHDIGDSLVLRKYKPKSLDGDLGDLINRISVVRTKCNYGGNRPWFICPVSGCGKRVAILYRDVTFKCRGCLKLLYSSQYVDKPGRLEYKLKVIRKRLGWDPNFRTGCGKYPKNMHFRAYRRLLLQHSKFEREWLQIWPIRAKELKKSLESRRNNSR